MQKPEKPLGPKGENCPLWGRDCSRVCQSCHWWTMVTHTGEDGKTQELGWTCAMNVIASGVHRTAHEVRHATAQSARVNNTIAKIHDQNVQSNMRLIEGLKPLLGAVVEGPALEGDGKCPGKLIEG